MDYSQLSKEELITLVKAKFKPLESTSQPEREDYQCKYIPTRGDRKRCEKNISTPYGFCCTHKNTVQARNARKAYDKEKSSEISSQEISNEILDNGASEEAPIEQEKIPEENSESPKDKSESLAQVEEDSSECKTDFKQEKGPESSDSHSIIEQKNSASKETLSSIKKHSLHSKYTPKRASKPKHTTTTVKLNRFKHFEHEATHIVFNPDSLKACGVQLKNGVVRELKDRDIRTCERYGWPYEVLSDIESEEEEEGDQSDEETEVLDGEIQEK